MWVSITKKIIIYSIVLGLSSTSIIGIYTYISTKDALLARTFDQLVSVRNEKKKRLESFFNERTNDIQNLLNFEDIGKLLNLPDSVYSGSDEMRKTAFRSRYTDYISAYLSANNFYNKLVFCDSTGKAVQISLHDKDLKYSNIGNNEKKLIKNLRLNHLAESPMIYESRDLRPDSTPTLIIVDKTTRENGNEGLVLLEISMESINQIMFEDNPLNGLGKTGEAYLVGTDFLMRSSSRFQENSVYNTRVNTKAVRLAVEKDSTGNEIIRDYRNVRVLSSFGKIEIGNITWAIVSEIDYSEAMVPIVLIRNNILYLLAIVGLLLMGVVALVSNMITAPIKKLRVAADEIAGGGEYGKTLDLTVNDEIGDLITAFNQMTLRLRYQAEKLEEQKLASLQSLIDGQEIERQRLSRELHDGLAQLILAIKMRSERALNANPEVSHQIIEEIRTLLVQALSEIRNISNDLMPAVLSEFGLKQAVTKLVNEVGKTHNLEINFSCSNELKISNKKIETYAYRIIQEAFNNIVKHADAQTVELKISFKPEFLVMDVKDDGKGFDTKNKHLGRGNGIANIKERISLLGGKFDLSSKSGKGTRIFVKIPMF